MQHRYVCFLLFAGCAATPAAPTAHESAPTAPAAQSPSAPHGPYLGEVSGPAPTIFAPGVVSRQYQELNAAFSPAGDELFYTLADPMRTHYTLLHMKQRDDGSWDGPAVAPFSGRYSEADPAFTGDGKRLYFISKRPRGPEVAPNDFDIWYVDRTASGWGEPVNVGAPVNTPDDEYYVSVTRTGSLYWSQKGEIKRAIPTGNSYRVETLGPAVNTTSDEFDPYVSPDESYLIFASRRPDSLNSADLYVSFRADGSDGEWQPAHWLGPTINSTALEYCPIVSPDGSRFFFTSYRRPKRAVPVKPLTIAELTAGDDNIENGMGNIYSMDAGFLETMRRGGPPP
jgi:Tol biopolymer transport system component